MPLRDPLAQPTTTGDDLGISPSRLPNSGRGILSGAGGVGAGVFGGASHVNQRGAALSEFRQQGGDFSGVPPFVAKPERQRQKRPVLFESGREIHITPSIEVECPVAVSAGRQAPAYVRGGHRCAQ